VLRVRRDGRTGGGEGSLEGDGVLLDTDDGLLGDARDSIHDDGGDRYLLPLNGNLYVRTHTRGRTISNYTVGPRLSPLKLEPPGW
jgi:hypothetical protein